MPVEYKCLKVFLCTASGTDAEEKAVAQAIETINRGTRKHLSIELEHVTWRDLPPTAPNLKVARKQAEYTAFVKECDVFILVLWKRHGSYEPGETRTNLEREVDEAVSRLKRGDNITMLTYFRNFVASTTPNEQERGVVALRDKLYGEGIIHFAYDEPSQFEDHILADLYETLLEVEFNTRQHRALRSFWSLGRPADGRVPARLVIGYPGMDRAYMRLPEGDADLWLRRLVPNIVYEDHRALQKLDKVLRLAGITEFHTCTLANLPENWWRTNRCWVCIPRNPQALERLKNHARYACFSVRRAAPPDDAFFFWKRPGSCHSHSVKSPLSIYLRKQRKGADLKAEWNRTLRDVVARDYAIIAKFPIAEEDAPAREGHLMEFFIGGIRGLGTWGAAWFMDHRSHALEKSQGYEIFQCLLEVTYMDGHIQQVHDVSQECGRYFERQMQEAKIDEVIQEMRRHA